MFAIGVGMLAGAGCPSNGDCSSAGTTGTTGGATGGATEVGGAVPGIVDTHCWGPGAPDAGLTFLAQAVQGSSCYVVDGGLAYDEDAGVPGSEYGPTIWNASGNDDDCKYFVGWRSTPITANAEVTFWVSAQLSTNGAPLTGLGEPLADGLTRLYLEVAGADGGLDQHLSPTISGNGVNIQETPPGSGVYQVGPAKFFDASGLWYVRFHFNENCDDVLPDSPHGHAAFYVNVP
jgi:hypothetical protein